MSGDKYINTSFYPPISSSLAADAVNYPMPESWMGYELAVVRRPQAS